MVIYFLLKTIFIEKKLQQALVYIEIIDFFHWFNSNIFFDGSSLLRCGQDKVDNFRNKTFKIGTFLAYLSCRLDLKHIYTGQQSS